MGCKHCKYWGMVDDWHEDVDNDMRQCHLYPNSPKTKGYFCCSQLTLRWPEHHEKFLRQRNEYWKMVKELKEKNRKLKKLLNSRNSQLRQLRLMEKTK